MERLHSAVFSSDIAALKEVLPTVEYKTIAIFLNSVAGETINPEIIHILINHLPPCDHLSHNYHTEYLNTALHRNAIANVKIMLAHKNCTPYNELKYYVSVPQEGFGLLLESSKIEASSEILDCLLANNHPQKITSYLNSNKFIIPSPQEISRLIQYYKLHYYSLSLILKDTRIDLSLVSRKLIRECIDNELLMEALKERLPNIINSLIERKRVQEANYEVYKQKIDDEWSKY
jgi:hypothetical protein